MKSLPYFLLLLFLTTILLADDDEAKQEEEKQKHASTINPVTWATSPGGDPQALEDYLNQAAKEKMDAEAKQTVGKLTTAEEVAKAQEKNRSDQDKLQNEYLNSGGGGPNAEKLAKAFRQLQAEESALKQRAKDIEAVGVSESARKADESLQNGLKSFKEAFAKGASTDASQLYKLATDSALQRAGSGTVRSQNNSFEFNDNAEVTVKKGNADGSIDVSVGSKDGKYDATYLHAGTSAKGFTEAGGKLLGFVDGKPVHVSDADGRLQSFDKDAEGTVRKWADGEKHTLDSGQVVTSNPGNVDKVMEQLKASTQSTTPPTEPKLESKSAKTIPVQTAQDSAKKTAPIPAEELAREKIALQVQFNLRFDKKFPQENETVRANGNSYRVIENNGDEITLEAEGGRRITFDERQFLGTGKILYSPR